VCAADLTRHHLAVNFLYVAIVPANSCQHTKFQLSSSISLKDMRGSQNKNWELLISLADKFLYRALVHMNAYKCGKFQLPSSISYGDMEVV